MGMGEPVLKGAATKIAKNEAIPQMYIYFKERTKTWFSKMHLNLKHFRLLLLLAPFFSLLCVCFSHF